MIEIPFAPSYNRNRDAGCPAGADPCAVCAKPVRWPWRYEVRMYLGTALLMPDEVPPEGQDMGWFPVGSDCRAKLPAAYVVRASRSEIGC